MLSQDHINRLHSAFIASNNNDLYSVRIATESLDLRVLHSLGVSIRAQLAHSDRWLATVQHEGAADCLNQAGYLATTICVYAGRQASSRAQVHQNVTMPL